VLFLPVFDNEGGLLLFEHVAQSAVILDVRKVFHLQASEVVLGIEPLIGFKATLLRDLPFQVELVVPVYPTCLSDLVDLLVSLCWLCEARYLVGLTQGSFFRFLHNHRDRLVRPTLNLFGWGFNSDVLALLWGHISLLAQALDGGSISAAAEFVLAYVDCFDK
jgi:hypothetical protein